MKWERDISGGLLINGWTPDKIAERNEELAWLMRSQRPWRLINGHLLSGKRDQIAEDLRQAMQIGRGQWKAKLGDLALSGEPMAAEGTYGALGAYPLEGEIGYTVAATTETVMLTAANSALYMPIPQRGLLAPQAYRFALTGRVTTVATAANVSWGIRIGNAATSPSLGVSAAIAKPASALTALTWIVKGDMTITQIGPPGLNARAVGAFDAKLNSAVGGAYTAWAWSTGATFASFDSTVAPNASANGGQIIPTLISSANTAEVYTFQQIHFMDWN